MSAVYKNYIGWPIIATFYIPCISPTKHSYFFNRITAVPAIAVLLYEFFQRELIRFCFYYEIYICWRFDSFKFLPSWTIQGNSFSPIFLLVQHLKNTPIRRIHYRKSIFFVPVCFPAHNSFIGWSWYGWRRIFYYWSVSCSRSGCCCWLNNWSLFFRQNKIPSNTSNSNNYQNQNNVCKSLLIHMIKNFSSPKIKIWFEPIN